MGNGHKWSCLIDYWCEMVSWTDFEDMSCEMIYGLHPPPLEEDAAYQQPCYALCKYKSVRLFAGPSFLRTDTCLIFFSLVELHIDKPVGFVQVKQRKESRIVLDHLNSDNKNQTRSSKKRGQGPNGRRRGRLYLAMVQHSCVLATSLVYHWANPSPSYEQPIQLQPKDVDSIVERPQLEQLTDSPFVAF